MKAITRHIEDALSEDEQKELEKEDLEAEVLKQQEEAIWQKVTNYAGYNLDIKKGDVKSKQEQALQKRKPWLSKASSFNFSKIENYVEQVLSNEYNQNVKVDTSIFDSYLPAELRRLPIDVKQVDINYDDPYKDEQSFGSS